MNVALLPLLPRQIDFRSKKFRLLKDRHLFDNNAIATTDTTVSYFVTVGTKRKSAAIFTGDYSLVKEANLFLPVQLQAVPRYGSARIPMTIAEAPPFWNLGWFQWNVIVPETVTVDEDRLVHISPGPELMDVVTTHVWAGGGAGDRCYANRRTYLVGANKIIPGGRAIEFTINWQEAANGLTAAMDLSVVFAGGEYEPGAAA